MGKRMYLVLGCLLLLLVAGIYMFPIYTDFFVQNRDDLGYDFFCEYISGTALNSHAPNIYDTESLGEFRKPYGKESWTYDVSPHILPYFLILFPFFLLPFKSAYLLFLTVSLILYFAGIIIFASFLIPERKTALPISLLLIAFTPVCSICIDNITWGQIGFIVYFFLALTFYFGEKKRWLPCGVFLSIAVLCKMWPLLLIFYYIRRKEYKVIISLATSLVLLSVLSGFLWGFERFAQYFELMRHMDEIGRTYTTILSNQSLMGLVAASVGERLSTASLKIIHLAIIIIFLYYLLRLGAARKEERISNALEFSAFLISAMILAPFNFPTHHVLNMIPFIAIISAILDDKYEQKARFHLMALLILFVFYFLLDGQIVTRPWIVEVHRFMLKYDLVLLMNFLLLFGIAATCEKTKAA